MKHAWEWKEKHGGIILRAAQKLGASCDWERTKFTMDQDMSAAVIKFLLICIKRDSFTEVFAWLTGTQRHKLPFPTKRLYTKK